MFHIRAEKFKLTKLYKFMKGKDYTYSLNPYNI